MTFTVPDFSLGDIFWLCVKIVIASAVVRWTYVTVSNHWFNRETREDETDEDADEEGGKDDKEEDEDEDDEEEKEEKEEAIFESEKVFHVGDVKSGGTRIVIADDEDQAKRIAARASGADEDDLVASEVYDSVTRTEDKR